MLNVDAGSAKYRHDNERELRPVWKVTRIAILILALFALIYVGAVLMSRGSTSEQPATEVQTPQPRP